MTNLVTPLKNGVSIVEISEEVSFCKMMVGRFTWNCVLYSSLEEVLQIVDYIKKKKKQQKMQVKLLGKVVFIQQEVNEWETMKVMSLGEISK